MKIAKVGALLVGITLFQCSMDETTRKNNSAGAQGPQKPGVNLPPVASPADDGLTTDTVNPPQSPTIGGPQGSADCVEGDAFQCAAENAVIQFTNNFRRENGLPDFIGDARYSFVARDWSGKQSKGACGGGSICHAGFPDAREQIFRSKFRSDVFFMSENVAMNAGFNNSDPQQVAKSLVDQWINSPGHRQNMLSRARAMGAGVLCTANGSCFGTQIFAQ